jgi:hypothetical protein
MIDSPSIIYHTIIAYSDLKEIEALHQVCNRWRAEIDRDENQHLLIDRILSRIFHDPEMIKTAQRLLRPKPFSVLKKTFDKHRFVILFDRSASMQNHISIAKDSLSNYSQNLEHYQTNPNQPVATLDFFPLHLEEAHQIQSSQDIETIPDFNLMGGGSNFFDPLQKGLKEMRKQRKACSLWVFSDFEFEERHVRRLEKTIARIKTPKIYSFKLEQAGNPNSLCKWETINELFDAKTTQHLSQLTESVKSSLIPSQPALSQPKRPSDGRQPRSKKTKRS